MKMNFGNKIIFDPLPVPIVTTHYEHGYFVSSEIRVNPTEFIVCPLSLPSPTFASLKAI